MPHQIFNSNPELQLLGTSGVVANATANAILSPPQGYTAYLTGFAVTGLGAAAPANLLVTVSGISQNQSYTLAIPMGVTTAITPLIIAFTQPIQASAPGVPIVVTCPAAGTGNTQIIVNAQGYALA
jgi:hypothetical protein